MTDTPNKIEEIRKALEGATPGPWQWQEHTAYGIESVLEPYMCQAEGFIEVSGPDARLIALSPDMARIVLAAEKLARAVDIEANKAGMDHSVLQELAAYRKAVEGDQ